MRDLAKGCTVLECWEYKRMRISTSAKEVRRQRTACGRYSRKLLDWLVARTIASMNYTRSIEFRKIVKAMQLSKGAFVLSVGCGEGHELHYFSVRNRSIEPIGIDVNIRLLEPGSTHFSTIQFVAAAAEALPFREGAFDRISCSSAVEHFEDDTMALKEINRCLRGNGLSVITTDSCKWGHLGEWSDRHAKIAFVKRYYSRELLESSLVEAGLIPTHFEDVITCRLAPYFLGVGVKYEYKGKLYLLISMIGIFANSIFGRLARESDGFTLLAVARKSLKS